MMVIGKSKAALTMICDAIVSNQDSRALIILNNLKIKEPFYYNNFFIKEADVAQGSFYVLGAVMPETKKELRNIFPLKYMTIANKTAFFSGNCEIGEGCLIDSHVSIAGGVTIEDYVTLYANSVVSHDSHIGKFTTICPGVIICGGVHIGKETFIGAGTVIKNGITIGNNVTIGCGSVVIKDIEDGKTVYGNPAKAMI